jgi:CRISPR-associated protein Cas2
MMMVLVTYDVSTTEAGGAGRLRRVAKACRDFGQRVQYSVFEIEVDPAQWVLLKARLESIVDLRHDSLRYYHLGAKWQGRIEHVGAKAAADLGGTMII